MRMRTLGGTGIKVSAYCLGAMMFGAWGNPDHEESVRIIHAALDAGINVIDTADVYSAGESEEIVGEALRGRRDSVVLATKAHSSMGDDVNMRGNSRRWLVREVENSLRRLGTDYIDLYQMHRPDPDTDIDETLSALSDLVRSGKVRAIGSSTFPAEQIVEAQWVAERRGHIRFRSEQPPYSIFVRGIEASVLPTCQRYGMGVIAWSPLSGGWLTGRIRGASSVDMSTLRAQRMPHRFDPSLPGNAAKLAAVEELVKVAADAGVSLIHLAVAFVVGHPGVTSAIIGPRTMDQLTDLLAGADVTLSDDVLDRIDQIVPPGVTLNPGDAGWQAPVLADAGARRRPAAERAAGLPGVSHWSAWAGGISPARPAATARRLRCSGRGHAAPDRRGRPVRPAGRAGCARCRCSCGRGAAPRAASGPSLWRHTG
jgi:aryl-alcohol dehydrogenase-like predicted oxidoreductase